MQKRIVFYDEEGYKTYDQLMNFLQTRIAWLQLQGFSKEQIQIIILEDKYFQKCILEGWVTEKVKQLLSN